MGSIQKYSRFRILPIGLVLGLFGCATTNRTVFWQEPRGQGPISRFIQSKNPKQESAAAIVADPEPGEALPSDSNIVNAPAGGPPPDSESAGKPELAATDGGSQRHQARLSQPPVSETVSRFFPLFNRRPSVNLPIPPRPPLPNAENLNALANQPKQALGEADIWAQTARTRALALLESDRAKARLKPRSDPRTGTTGTLAAREARPPYELVDNQETVLPVSLEINTHGARDRAAIARAVTPPAVHAHQTRAAASSALPRQRGPKPDPWAHYPDAKAMSSAKSGVTIGAPTDAVALAQPAAAPVVATEPIAPVEELALAQPAAAGVEPEPETSAVPLETASEPAPAQLVTSEDDRAVEPSSSPATEPEPAVEPSSPTDATSLNESPMEFPAVSEAEPAIASQALAAPLENPREVPLTVLSDRIELPEEIDAASESRAAAKMEPETERVSLAETATVANQPHSRDIPIMVPDPSFDVPAPKAIPDEKAITKPSAPKPAKTAVPDKPAETKAAAAAAPKPAAEPSKTDTPPVPEATSEPESEAPKAIEAEPAKPEPTKPPKDSTKAETSVPTEAKPKPIAAPLAQPTAAAAVEPANVVEYPRWTSKTSPEPSSPRFPSKVAPGAINPVMPAPAPTAPTKALPAAAQNRDPQRIPIGSPYNPLSPYAQPELEAPTKSRPSESPTAGWKVPHSPSKQPLAQHGTPIASRRSVLPPPEVVAASSRTPSILGNRERVMGHYDLNELFPATYHGTMTKVTPLNSRAGEVQDRVVSNTAAALTNAATKRKSILGRFLARFQREDDDTPVPTPADAVAGLVNPLGLWIEKPVRPSSIASEPGDIPQRGEGVQRVSGYGVGEASQR